MSRNYPPRTAFVLLLSAGWLSFAGCRETPRPAAETPAATPRTTPVELPAQTQPAAAKTIAPASMPAAGWLHIESLANQDRPARIPGQFPEANKMDVDTDNVSALTLDLSMLPIRPRHRIILRIDKQGIDISPRHRGRIRLERSPTGQWTVTTPPPP